MNANVTMPIIELDNLRNQIKEANEQIELFKKHEKSVKLTVKQHSYEQKWISGQLTRNYYTPGYYKTIDSYVELKPEYIGFEEVVEELKKEAENNVIDKIGNLERKIISQKEKYQKLITSHAEALVTDNNKNQEYINKLNEEYTNTINALEKEIKILKGELVDLDKDEQIRKLKEELEAFKNKSFFQRLFNL